MREPRTTTWRGTSRRAALRGAGLGLAGAAAVACSAPGGVEPPAASKAPVALSFMSWRPIAMDQFEPIWTEYGKKNNVTFDVDKSDDGNLTKLTTMFAADAGMDLFDAATGVMPRMYDAGSVLQLDKYLTRDKLTLDKEWAILGIERWRQKTYGVPYWVEPFGIYYNKSLFKQKGIADPWDRAQNKGDWTLEEMVEAARKINDPANDVWGLDWGPHSAYSMGPLLWSAGATHYQYDPNVEWTLGAPEVTQAFNTAIDWLMRQKIDVTSPDAEATASRDRLQGGKPGIGSGGINRFSTGKIGIHFRSVNDWRRTWPIVRTAFEWDMLPVPAVRGRPGASFGAGHPVCAYSKTKQPDRAWEFMSWLMNDEFQGVLADGQFLVPAKQKFQERFFRPPDQYRYQHPQVFANVFRRPYGVQWAHYNAPRNVTAFNTEAERLVKGEVPLQGGLADLQRVLNQDVNYGGGENPFKGLKLPVQPK
ncbi:MAG TPA: extracellular solute-binding protein [Chloroflexota bacterium]|nr:extracellular solute-binding protein [Chloroflexota bacterium]